jgi:hypothetical protein
MSQLYYIFSIKWTKPGDFMATWWREDDSGYCHRLDWAGKYMQEQIDEKPDYYNDGYATVAIPCEEVDKRILHVVEAGGWLYEYINKAKEQAQARADSSTHGVPVPHDGLLEGA